MSLKKTTISLTIFVMVLALGTPSGLEAKKHNNGPDVEAIYESIRNAGPLYEWDEDDNVTFENEGMTLACTLTVPQTGKKCPIIITLAGFIGTRDEEPIAGSNDTVFGRLCHVLAGQGIASLRVDYRGYGESEGDFAQACNFSTQVSDISAAVDFICRDLKHQVNTKSIGILGFSQGGLVGSTVAARDRRVDSLVLWSAPAHAPHDYEGLLTKEGIQAGLALSDGGSDMFAIYLCGQYCGEIPLGKKFFEDLFGFDALTEVRGYKNPMMYIAGNQDVIVWPQPIIGKTFINYHKGEEKLVVLDAGHEFNYWDETDPEKLNDAIYWSTAWFIKTLKDKD